MNLRNTIAGIRDKVAHLSEEVTRVKRKNSHLIQENQELSANLRLQQKLVQELKEQLKHIEQN